VWAALVARQELLLDALPVKAWPPRKDEQAPFHFAVDWPATPEPTEIAVTLHEMGGGVRVDVRHAGWKEGAGAAWDRAIEGHFAGWLQGVALLGAIVEGGVDGRASTPALRAAERYLISGEVPATASPIWRSLTDPEALERWSDGVLDGAQVVEQVEDRFLRWRLPSGGELVAILRPTPRGTHIALAEYGVADTAASAKWPPMFERLTRFLV
jgi:uncharacterized protein YndB with AHSA1/START domain